MSNPLIKIPLEGNTLTSDGKSIFFPQAEINNYGCNNCIWKLNFQCPHNLKGEEKLEEGICAEMLSFLSGLADKEGSLESIWEKFHLYKLRLQESADYKDLMQLNEKVRAMEEELNNPSGKYNKEDMADVMSQLKADRLSAKIWFAKMNQNVIFSLQKINDRKTKEKDTPRLPGIMSSGTINFNITPQIEDKK